MDPTSLETPIWYFSQIEGPQYRPQNTVILIMGTPGILLISGKPPFVDSVAGSLLGWRQRGGRQRQFFQGCCHWANGGIDPENSHYLEGQGT